MSSTILVQDVGETGVEIAALQDGFSDLLPMSKRKLWERDWENGSSRV